MAGAEEPEAAAVKARVARSVRATRAKAEAQVKRLKRERLADEDTARRARDGRIDPLKARLRHGAVGRVKEQLADAKGAIGAPWRASDLLGQMTARGTISPAMREAGERFGERFRIAGFPDLKAAALIRIGGGAGPGTVNGNERARREVAAMIRALGGFAAPAASCLWHVVGLEWSLRKWGEIHWNCNNKTASGVLIAGLGVLVEHFRLDRLGPRNRSH